MQSLDDYCNDYSRYAMCYVVIKHIRKWRKMININERIRDLRQYKGYSEQYMASKLNISDLAYKKYETNYKINVLELLKVAEILEVSMDYLIGRIDIPAPVIMEENLGEVVEILKQLRK